jgi:hypothetical protein
MDVSLADWLALREAADAAARSENLTHEIAAALGIPSGGALRILDLASGTGSNVRYLAPRLLTPQDWLLVDRNPALLARTPASTPAAFIQTRVIDLGVLDDPTLFFRWHLVTASALLDLVSESWMRALAVRCLDAGAAVLFALTYNGRSHCIPREPEDDQIRELLNTHQCANDHGFGRAAGPNAVECAVDCLNAVGYRVEREASDWDLGPDAREMQRQLVKGWASAACEIASDRTAAIDNWLARRLAHIDAGRSRITVGHEDIAAFRRF